MEYLYINVLVYWCCSRLSKELPWQTAGLWEHVRRSLVCTGRGCLGSEWCSRQQSSFLERAQCSSETPSGWGCPRAMEIETLGLTENRVSEGVAKQKKKQKSTTASTHLNFNKSRKHTKKQQEKKWSSEHEHIATRDTNTQHINVDVTHSLWWTDGKDCYANNATNMPCDEAKCIVWASYGLKRDRVTSEEEPLSLAGVLVMSWRVTQGQEGIFVILLEGLWSKGERASVMIRELEFSVAQRRSSGGTLCA